MQMTAALIAASTDHDFPPARLPVRDAHCGDMLIKRHAWQIMIALNAPH